MSRTYPPASFYFEVNFEGATLNAENSFQSVTGLTVEMQTETIKEGGENRFEHVLPVRTKYSPLTLKRGLVKDSKLIAWCKNALLNFDIQPMNLSVILLHSDRSSSGPLMRWEVINAWPKKWSVSDFNAEQSAIAIESLELNYSYFTERTSLLQGNSLLRETIRNL